MTGGSLRRAIGWSALVMLAALVAMAVTLTVGLQRADRLLDRLSRSEGQIARITRIEADIDSMLADTLGSRKTDAELAAAASKIESRFSDYRGSIQDERRLIGANPTALDYQREEAGRAQALGKVFSSLAVGLLDPNPAARLAARAQVEAGRDLFSEMAGEVVSRERQEVNQAFVDMKRLRGGFTWLAFSIPLVVGLLASGAAWLMMSRVAEPLRVIEAAAERAGRGARPARLEVHGFSEFRSLAQAFNRMGEWMGARDAGLTLGALTLDLRAREARLGGAALSLPRREFELLRRLAETPGASVARHELINEVWGPSSDVTDNLVDVYVGYLRRKLSVFADAPKIETVRGIGFRLVAPIR